MEYDVDGVKLIRVESGDNWVKREVVAVFTSDEAASDIYDLLHSLDSDAEELQEENAELREQIDSLEYDIEALKGDLTYAHEEAASWQAEAENLSDELSELEYQNACLQEYLYAAECGDY